MNKFKSNKSKHIKKRIESANYENSTEVVKDPSRIHAQHSQKLVDELKVEIEKGWSGKDSNRSIKDIISTSKT